MILIQTDIGVFRGRSVRAWVRAKFGPSATVEAPTPGSGGLGVVVRPDRRGGVSILAVIDLIHRL